MKYIDAEKLIAEIERRRSEAEKTFNHIFEYASSAKEISEWVSREYNNILSYIDSLQQEQREVDLEDVIEEYWIANGWSKVITLGKFKVIARYFYRVGQLNSK